MEQFRRDLTARPDEFPEIIRSVEAATGMTVEAECYKRPKPTENPDLTRFFAWKSKIGLIRHEDPGEGMFGADLAKKAAELFEQLLPLYDYFNRF